MGSEPTRQASKVRSNDQSSRPSNFPAPTPFALTTPVNSLAGTVASSSYSWSSLRFASANISSIYLCHITVDWGVASIHGYSSDRQTPSVYQRHCEAYGPQHSACRISKNNRRMCLKNRLTGRARLSPSRKPTSNARLSRSFALPNHVAMKS